ncbi:MAG: hypothetical protein KGL53_14265 [Elusimicrobia bacterium]|nr:hypothetical protein [Elusimicrobiota bacterium]
MLLSVVLSAALAAAAAPPPEVVMGEYVVARAPDTPEVRTFGVGPCLALALYDPEAKVGALAHVSPMDDIAPSVDEIMRDLLRAGADPRRMTARVVGGWRGGAGLGVHWTSPDMLRRLRESLRRWALVPDVSRTLVTVDLGSSGAGTLHNLRLDLETGAFEDLPASARPLEAVRSVVREPSEPGLMRPHAASLAPGR